MYQSLCTVTIQSRLRTILFTAIPSTWPDKTQFMAHDQVIYSLDHSFINILQRKLADDSVIDTSTSQIAAAGNPPSHAANANQRNGGYTTGPFALRGETQYQSLGYTADNQDSGLDGM